MRSLEGLAAVMVPKAESAQALAQVHQALGAAALLPLIETAAGLDAVKSIATAPGVLRLVVGTIDFMAHGRHRHRLRRARIRLGTLRFAVAMATRAAKLAPAIDGVTVQTGDAKRLHDDTRRALRFGFGGKLCIHPNQVAAVHAAMAPSEAELDWARRVLAAELMQARGVVGSFGTGGVTGTPVEMLEAGLFRNIFDVQAFDLRAVESYRHDRGAGLSRLRPSETSSERLHATAALD